MEEYIPNEELENKTVVRKYRELLQVVYPRTTAEERKQIRKAFVLATNAHFGVRRKSGEPYIYHPIAVAMICCSEMNLGATSVICALLHDVVEDTDYTLDNMRTLDAIPHEKQLKIASETSYFYVPFAHRLGLYSIKSELEDYAMRYTNPTEYFAIAEKLKDSEKERSTMIPEFIAPIQEALEKAGIKAEITSRTKSVSSIYNKMLRKQINFEDVYDIFAVRFVFDSPMYEEFDICWKIYRIICDLYRTNPMRDRNFLTHPKPNGYQSLHVTAMSKQGRWVEVQIRSKRMDEIAEKGLAAHYRYKEEGEMSDADLDHRLEDWLLKAREILDSKDADALDFLSEVRLNLGLKEIYVFTPKGDMKTMPQGATVLDFAYALHTNLGDHCIGAKVNYNITPVNKALSNGDQVEIITSKKQFPKAEWLEFVQTPKARRSIKDFFRNQQHELASSGKLLLKQYFDELDVEFNEENVRKLMEASLEKNPEAFWNSVASKKLSKQKVSKLLSVKNAKELADFQQKVSQEIDSKPLNQLIDEQMNVTPNAFLLDDDYEQIKYVLADCCNPIPGDTVVGFQVSDNRIVVHQTSCPNAIAQMSRFGNRIIKTKWRKGQDIAFLSGIKLKGFDRKGIIKEMMDVVTSQMDLNIRSLNIESKNNVFTGTLMLYIQSVRTLNNLIEQLRQIDQMESVERIGYEVN